VVAVLAGATDVHARSLADRLESLEDLDVLGCVLGLRHGYFLPFGDDACPSPVPGRLALLADPLGTPLSRFASFGAGTSLPFGDAACPSPVPGRLALLADPLGTPLSRFASFGAGT